MNVFHYPRRKHEALAVGKIVIRVLGSRGMTITLDMKNNEATMGNRFTILKWTKDEGKSFPPDDERGQT